MRKGKQRGRNGREGQVKVSERLKERVSESFHELMLGTVENQRKAQYIAAK